MVIVILFMILFLICDCLLLEKSIEKNRKKFNKKFNTLLKRIKHIEENQNTTFDYINGIYSDLERLDINEKD